MNKTKTPSLIDALSPIVFLLILLSLAVYYFGDDSSSGPNQMALLVSAGFAGLVGIKNGFNYRELEQAIIQGISVTLGAILILLAIGSLIGTWLLSGTVPSMIFYGLQILSPDYFYVSCSLICALVAISIGSSWTVAATIGVALIGIATGLNASLTVTAGAIISGAYFGDKLSPLSDTTNLAPAVSGAELFAHIRHMAWSTVPAFILTLLIFLIMGLNQSQGNTENAIGELLTSLQQQFTIGWYLLIPLLVTLGLAMVKCPAFPAIGLGALTGGFWAVLFQQPFIQEYAGGQMSSLDANITVIWRVMFQGLTINGNNPVLNTLLSGGGIGAMLNTIWLIICAMTFGSVMEKTGGLKLIVSHLIGLSKKAGSLIATTIVTGFGTNCVAADQYIAIVMPGRMFKHSYQQRQLAPVNLSRALEDGGTVTSPLIPWNTCDASFKQGSTFRQWRTTQPNEHYHHPFGLPQHFNRINLQPHWQANHKDLPFALACNGQSHLFAHDLAPKQITTAEYQAIENYGYHFDSAAFSEMLKKHCQTTHNIQHIVENIVEVRCADNGDIQSLVADNGREISGQLFIDCSGLASRLLGEHYQVPLLEQKHSLFTDRALAVQLPYQTPDSPIASTTLSTAQRDGWIWDIGLQSRKGIGYVWSSSHTTCEKAYETLEGYLRQAGHDIEQQDVRSLTITPGYRQQFWTHNCVAVGLSAGFVEPLEASSLVLVELSATMIAEYLPVVRQAMDPVANHFNRIFTGRWQKIIDFLKLHYVLSQRQDSDFWRDHQHSSGISESLQSMLALWQHQSPCDNGFIDPYDLFPAASYQYILYGMNFHTHPSYIGSSEREQQIAQQCFFQTQERARQLTHSLPGNRELLNNIATYGLQSI